MASRGSHLVAADRGFATGGGLIARLFAGGFGRILDRIDAGLAEGRVELTLPDGAQRILGGRGEGPVAVVRLNSYRALVRLAASGSVGWYKAWARGEWASPDPVPLFDLFMRNAVTLGEAARAKGPWRFLNRIAHAVRDNSPRRARQNIAFHYDLGNDFYAAWLDAGMTYSTAIFADPAGTEEPLETAQARKYRYLLTRLNLEDSDQVVEIGCGWGGLAEQAAREHDVSVTGLTLSAEQKDFADRRLAKAGLSDRVTISLTDYREIEGRFDALVSVEMAEAVGQAWWPAYLDAVARALKPGGRAALQLISIRNELFEAYAASADFIQTYIFPGGLLIEESRFARLAAAAGLEWTDRRAYGAHYAATLRAWRGRYEAAMAEERFPPGFTPEFHALWLYYLMYCEGGFRGGGIDVIQVTLIKR